jgi:hypothetical protein
MTNKKNDIDRAIETGMVFRHGRKVDKNTYDSMVADTRTNIKNYLGKKAPESDINRVVRKMAKNDRLILMPKDLKILDGKEITTEEVLKEANKIE